MALRGLPPLSSAPTPPSGGGSALVRARIALRLLTGNAAPAVRSVIRHFRGDDISLRAAALTYISVFSLVPMVTLALLLLSSLHQQTFHDLLEAFVKDILAPGVSPGIREGSSALLERFIRAASTRAASLFSFFALVITAGTLLKNLDASLNELWAVRKNRPWAVRLLHYALALTLGPPLIALSLFGSKLARDALVNAHVPGLVIALGSFASPVIALMLLYTYAPNAPVRLRPALLGALAAGLGWSAARVGYSAFAAQTFRYNLVYGSLGAAPLFLLWLYVSWMLVLFGARLAYAVQHARFRDSWPLFELHPRGPELLAARIGIALARAWAEGDLPVTRSRLSKSLAVPEDTLIPALDALERAGLLVFLEQGGINPTRDPATIHLAETCAAVRTGAPLPELHALVKRSPDSERLDALLTSADGLWASRLQGVSWADLAIDQNSKEILPTPAPSLVEGSRNP